MDFEQDTKYGIPEYEQVKDINKNTENKKIRPKDYIINTISAIIILSVMALLNGFVDGSFKFDLAFSWGIGVLVIVNWIGGIAFSYTMRKNGIGLGMGTAKYIAAEAEKQIAFDKIKDYTVSQKLLNKKIDDDFTYRKQILESNIAKLIQHKMPKGEVWKQGALLPKKTRPKIKLMVMILERMEPAQIDLMQLGENETSSIPKSMFTIQKDPTITGAKWFAQKGALKGISFLITPLIMTILAGALTGRAAFKSFMMIAGTLAVMIFNGAYAFASAYDAVTTKGIDRLKRISRILSIVTDNQ